MDGSGAKPPFEFTANSGCIRCVQDRRDDTDTPCPSLDHFIATHFFWMFFGTPLLQLAVLLRFFTRELPTWMDNAYRHENLADNLRSLRRVSRS